MLYRVVGEPPVSSLNNTLVIRFAMCKFSLNFSIGGGYTEWTELPYLSLAQTAVRTVKTAKIEHMRQHADGVGTVRAKPLVYRETYIPGNTCSKVSRTLRHPHDFTFFFSDFFFSDIPLSRGN